MIILILAFSIFLFGWVYLTSLDNKFQSMIASPVFKTSQDKDKMEVENKMLDEKIGLLEKKIATLENFITNPQIKPEVITISHPKTKDIFIDPKCLENQDDLNQCQILSSIQLDDNISIAVKPISQITKESNDITFEIYINNKKLTELSTQTINLFNTTSPIATVTYLNAQDITLNTNVGIGNVYTTFHYDGLGWIDYSKYTVN